MMTLHVSSAPHVHAKVTTPGIMRDVLVALLPATAVAVFYFGWNALLLVVLGVGSAVGTEALIQKLTHKKVTVYDLSAAVTGVLLALNLPAGAPWWLPVIGSAAAIALAKQAFGGLGFNFMNPALIGRAVLLAAWPASMTGSAVIAPTMFGMVDAVSSATPLAMLKEGVTESLPSLMDLFLGNIPGTIGEVSTLALLAGGAYLLLRRVITWHIPVFYIGTVALLTFLFKGFDFYLTLVYTLGGGLFLGAIFMATDYVSNPSTIKGQILFAAGCGILTTVIRLYGGYPEGVRYSILLMNVATPLIDKYVRDRAFGEVTKGA